MRKRYQVGGIAGAAILVLAGFAVWTTSKDGIGFASAKPYEHAFGGEAMTEIAPTEPVTQTTEALLSETEPFSVSFPINLNTADMQTLCTLPDIGAVTAQAILDERERLGGFTNRAQLRDIPGIGEKRYQTIAGLVYIENEQPLPSESAVPAHISETETTAPAVHFPLDLNTATLEALCCLPDIGEVTAQAILDERERLGGFTNRAQLLDVPGIGEKRYQVIAGLIYIENEQPLPTEPAESTIPATVSETDAPETEMPAPETQPPTVPVINLNTATLDELMLLPGCDETAANAILRVRDAIGGFHNPLEITIAPEISDAQYTAWKEWLAVDDFGNTQIYDETLPAE